MLSPSRTMVNSSGRRRHDNVGYKSTDRSRLNALVAQKGNCDDIIIVKHGLLTDTSFTNLAIFDGKHWVTPRHPLLPGTKRAALLDKGMIQKADITLEDLRNANKVSLFNAMIDFGEIEIAIENVHFHFWTCSISSDIQDILWLWRTWLLKYLALSNKYHIFATAKVVWTIMQSKAGRSSLTFAKSLP